MFCSDKGYTNGIFDCIAILLYNSDKGYLYHLNPQNYQSEEEIKKMQEELNHSIKDLKKGSQQCSAFLLGGIRLISDKLYKNISEVIDKKR